MKRVVAYHLRRNDPLSREFFLSRIHPEDRLRLTTPRRRGARLSRSRLSTGCFCRTAKTDWHIARGRTCGTIAGEISELMGVAIDVTAQVKANLDLRLQREQMAP